LDVYGREIAGSVPKGVIILASFLLFS
jgi:hypothetical protein